MAYTATDINTLIAARDHLEAESKARSKALDCVAMKLAKDLGVSAKDEMGLTPDEIKFHPEYVEARKKSAQSFEALRNFNDKYAKTIQKAKKR